MTENPTPICVETDAFIFEAPAGFQIDLLDEEAELLGPNEELLIVASYSIDEQSSAKELAEFAKSVTNAMREAANEPDLRIRTKLNRELTPNDLPVWSIQSDAKDDSHFFDQYALINGPRAALITVEGDFEHRSISALVEEAVYDIEFTA